jgi:hypothetical protein
VYTLAFFSTLHLSWSSQQRRPTKTLPQGWPLKPQPCLAAFLGPCAPVQGLPLHHAPQENAIFVNLRSAVVDFTQKERDAFLEDDLGLQDEDVFDILLDPSTLHLHLTLATPPLFAAILDCPFCQRPVDGSWQHPGVWLGGVAEPLVTVRVTGVPRFSLPLNYGVIL